MYFKTIKWIWILLLVRATVSFFGESKKIKDPASKEVRSKYLGVDNEVRTRDLDLGKVALYQLSYVHVNNPHKSVDCSWAILGSNQ